MVFFNSKLVLRLDFLFSLKQKKNISLVTTEKNVLTQL